MDVIELTTSSKYFTEVVTLLEMLDKAHHKKCCRHSIMKDRCNSSIDKCMILLDKDKLIGTISVFRDEKTSRRLKLPLSTYKGSLFVKQEFRGKGFGSLLMGSVKTPAYVLTKIDSLIFGVKLRKVRYNSQNYILYKK